MVIFYALSLGTRNRGPGVDHNNGSLSVEDLFAVLVVSSLLIFHKRLWACDFSPKLLASYMWHFKMVYRKGVANDCSVQVSECIRMYANVIGFLTKFVC